LGARFSLLVVAWSADCRTANSEPPAAIVLLRLAARFSLLAVAWSPDCRTANSELPAASSNG
jgi:hypothetical protein